jgi:two-component system OmpR family response regulator
MESNQPKKVLFVDDDPGIRRVAELSLSKIGKYDVLLAKSGREALDLLQTERPDVILLDVMMPGMEGPAVLQELLDNPDLASIPVIFLTAKVQKHEIEHFLKLGAIGVISKPFEPSQLSNDVKALYQARDTVKPS